MQEVSEKTAAPAVSLYLWGMAAFWAMEFAGAGLSRVSGQWLLHGYALGWYLAFGLTMGLAARGLVRVLKIPAAAVSTFVVFIYVAAGSALIPVGVDWARGHNPWLAALLGAAAVALVTALAWKLVLRAGLRLPWMVSLAGYNLLVLVGLACFRHGTAGLYDFGRWFGACLGLLLICLAWIVLRWLWEIFLSGCARSVRRWAGRVPVVLALALWALVWAEGRVYRLDTFYVLPQHGKPVNTHRTEPPPGAPDVIIVLLDCLRADRLGVQGYSRNITPVIDSFARQSVIYTRAYAQAPHTRPSVPTLFCSLYPYQHGVYSQGMKLADSLATMAEVLAENGYRTAALVASNPNVSHWSNLDQGFDEFYYFDNRLHGKPHLVISLQRRGVYLDGGRLTDRAIEWLRRRPGDKEPFFLYLHYMDAHAPYHPHRNHPTRRVAGFTPGRSQSECYDNQVCLLDYEFGRLLEGLRTRGSLDNTLLILTSDHGESFGEHGKFAHGTSLYNHQLHVPLIVRFPKGGEGGRPGGRDTSLAGLIDLGGLVMDHCLAPGHGRGSAGWPLPWPERDRGRGLLAQLNFSGYLLTALFRDNWKLIHLLEDRDEQVQYRFYDLETDPQEADDLFGKYGPEQGGQNNMLDLLGVFEDTIATGVTSAKDQPDVPAEERERLRALGYVK
ncbi:MAG: sulfatase [Gemmatimonadota bacterium]|nr:sulfatase [Gemmatimonadota bacterium]